LTSEAVTSKSQKSRVWVVGPDSVVAPIVEGLRSAGCLAGSADSELVFEWATAGDLVVLAGLAPADTVQTSDRLIARDLRVAIETRGAPELRRSLGESWHGLECVRLQPSKQSWLDSQLSRARDLLVASGVLILVAPAFLVTAILVKRSSPGPVFYTMTVVGRSGRPFLWRKIRTMRVGTPEDDRLRREQYRQLVATGSGVGGVTGSTKIVDSSRITPVGRFLRRHSFDELPQLWNVLVGEMAFVGPRPCLPYEYELQLPWQRRRYRVPPGLTGPWQAYGRSRVSVDEMALIDYCYGYRRNFWLDLRIMARTMKVIVRGEGGE